MSEPITKSLVVDTDPHTAFRTWVEEIDSWWPKSHSRSRDPRSKVVIEAKVGGRLYERAPDGTESEFGSVLMYDPPRRLIYHWFLGASAKQPTVVTINFESVPDGTRIQVEHRPGEVGVDDWNRTKDGYARAWEEVLRCYNNTFTHGATS